MSEDSKVFLDGEHANREHKNLKRIEVVLYKPKAFDRQAMETPLLYLK